jgi:hypothetical protein
VDSFSRTPQLGTIYDSHHKGGLKPISRSGRSPGRRDGLNGLGKTVQALGIFNALADARSMLVVCPASLKLNWKREAERWVVQKNGHRPRIAVAESSYWPQDADIVIINFEALGRSSIEGGKVLRREIREVGWDLLVIDECHKLKNPKTQRTKFTLAIKAKRIVALTGTPIPNRVKEIWPIVHHLAPQVFDNWWTFARRYCLPGDAPVLMADFSEKPIYSIEPGDKVIGWTATQGKQRRLCEATVEAVLKRQAPLVDIELENGDILRSTADHKWLTGASTHNRLHEYSMPRAGLPGGRGRGCASRIAQILDTKLLKWERQTETYQSGYLVGAFRGDGHCARLIKERFYPFKAKTTRSDGAIIIGFACKSSDKGFFDYVCGLLRNKDFQFSHRSDTDRSGCEMLKLETSSASLFALLSENQMDNEDWRRGFLGGIYDAEGSGQIIAQHLDHNPQTFAMILDALQRSRIDHVPTKDHEAIRMRGGRAALLRFWKLAQPVLMRKLITYVMNGGGKFMQTTSFVKDIRPLPGEHTVFTLTTSTGNYVAFGYGSKNCDMTKGPFGWQTDGASHLDELQAKLRSTIMVRRLKSEVLKELPPKRRQIIELPVADSMRHLISAEQNAWARAEQMRQELRVRVELAKASDDPKEYEEAVSALRSGAKACFEEMSRLRHETALAKLPLVIEHVTDTLDEVKKVLIGAHHVDVIEELGKVFDCEVIHGQVPVGDRLAIVDRFNDDPQRRVLVVQEISAGVGFSVKASHVIAAELQWVPGDMTQFEDRCHGVGRGIEGEPLLIQHLVLEGSLDAQMARTLIAKQEIADRALDLPIENSIDYELSDVDTEILASNELILPEKVVATCNTDVLHVESSTRPATYGTKREQLAHEAGSLTLEQIKTIHHGLRVLAGMCDGAFARDGSGFNRMDAEIGHRLAACETLSPLQAALGKSLMKKYSQTQLKGIVDSLY